MRHLVNMTLGSKAFLLGLFVTAVSFSYVLGNYSTDDIGARTTPLPGQVGTDNGLLRIKNPLITDNPNDPDIFDLGTAVYGSEIRRYLRASGGVAPYIWQERLGLQDFNIALNQADPPRGLPIGSTLQVRRDGSVSGKVGILPEFNFPPFQCMPSLVTFTVTVKDAARNTRTGTFQLSIICPQPNNFRLATTPSASTAGSVTALTGGDVGLPYLEKLESLDSEETLDGGPVRFFLNDGNHPNSTRFNASTGPVLPPSFKAVRVFALPTDATPLASFDRLEQVGLSLGRDGTIFGRPFFSGIYEVDILAIDGRVFAPIPNAPVPQRFEQTIRINVSGNDKFTPNTNFNAGQNYSDFVITNATIRTADSPDFADDSILISGWFNPNIQLVPNLRWQRNFRLNVGPNSFEATFDNKGVVKKLYPDGTNLEAYFETKAGNFRIIVNKRDLAWDFGFLFADSGTSTPIDVPIHIGVGNMWQSTELLRMQNRRNGLKSTLTYKYGNPGVTVPWNRSLSGGMLVRAAKGNLGFDIAAHKGCRWNSRFFLYPRLTEDRPGVLNAQGVPDPVTVLPNAAAPAGTTPGLDDILLVSVGIGQWRQTLSVFDPLIKVRSTDRQTTLRIREPKSGINFITIDNQRYVGRLGTFGIAGASSFGFPNTRIFPPDDSQFQFQQLPLGIVLFRTSSQFGGDRRYDFHGEGGRAMARNGPRTWLEFLPTGGGQSAEPDY